MAWWGWLLILGIVGMFASSAEADRRRIEERTKQNLDRMHDQLIGVCKRLGVDPVNPLH